MLHISTAQTLSYWRNDLTFISTPQCHSWTRFSHKKCYKNPFYPKLTSHQKHPNKYPSISLHTTSQTFSKHEIPPTLILWHSKNSNTNIYYQSYSNTKCCTMSHCHLPTNHPSKIHTPHKTPLTHNHFLLATILDNIINNFNFARFYVSNPLTCPTTFIQYYLPHKRDNICGSIGLAFSHQSNGNGLVYITSPKSMPKTKKWAHLTTKQSTIFIINHDDWLHYTFNPLQHRM